MRPNISIVVPFFNEEQNVAPLLGEIRVVCDGLGKPYEGIFVNDGSRDATGRRLDEVAKGWPEAKTFHFLSNHGQAVALFFGLNQAAGEILVTLDGDGQNDPADIPCLLVALGDHDIVAGVRARRQDLWLRLAMSRLANSVRSKLLGDGLRDTGCALKAFRREVVEAFLPIRTLYSFMGAMAVAANFRLCQIEVAHRPRRHGQSKYGLSVFWWKPLIDMIGILWFSRRRFPRNIKRRADSAIWIYNAGKNPTSKNRAIWTALGICLLVSASLHIYFLSIPGFEDDLRWQIHWGKRVARHSIPIYFYAFDLTSRNDELFVNLPFSRRRELLESLAYRGRGSAARRERFEAGLGSARA